MNKIMPDLERDIEEIIGQFTLLIRQVIQRNLHRGDDIDLEDVEQEVRLKIWKFLKKGKRVDNLASYIKRVAYSTTIDELRRMMKQRPTRDQDGLQKVFDGLGASSWRIGDFSPEGRLENAEVKRTMGAMVDTLSADRKKVLHLYLAGMSIEEISKSLAWDKPRVRHLFYRGLDDLKERGRLRREEAAGDFGGDRE
ncbi:MAG: sigma-70 family RNA polymerase sigma factor [Acidobacteriota bacterium]